MMSKDSERGQGAREPGPGDEANPAPLYRRVQADRQAQILDGRFPVGSQPPTVRELGEAFNASRMTVSRA